MRTASGPLRVAMATEVEGGQMTVERETYPDGRAPLDCAAASLAELRNIIDDFRPA